MVTSNGALTLPHSCSIEPRRAAARPIQTLHVPVYCVVPQPRVSAGLIVSSNRAARVPSTQRSSAICPCCVSLLLNNHPSPTHALATMDDRHVKTEPGFRDRSNEDTPVADARPSYKSYKKKYRKMRLQFDQRVQESEELHRKEEKAKRSVKRLAIENE